MKAYWLSALLFVSAVALGEGENIDKVNGSISVDNDQRRGDLSTVNGSIRVGDRAVVADIDTVNGGVTLGDEATADEIDNVNGSITLGEKARVARGIDSVNGSLTLDRGADVGGKIENVNGQIRLVAAHVGGGIFTTNGDVEIGANSRVENGIRVDKPDKSWFRMGKEKVPRIVIGPGAVVQGTLRFEREVKLYVSDSATIGTVVGATPVKYSGEVAPE
jgi:DUF4097 and DUF4098 domain-containing protein YvlB